MKMTGDSYYVNRHSCFLLQYHLVLVTKYRKPIIAGEIQKALYDYTWNYFSDRDCAILEMNGEADHIHILFEAPPQINLASFVNAFKSASSRNIRANFPQEIEKVYWKPCFWSLSYFIATVSERSTQAVRTYIKNQKETDE